jgi:hypothetical protein
MKTYLTKKYFFGYLFVRIAKAIAIVTFIIGIVFVVLRYAQADNAADSVRYRGSVALDQRLDKLGYIFTRTLRLVSAFNPRTESAKLGPLQFDRSIDSDGDFDRLLTQLHRAEADRQAMKDLIVARFESLVFQIQQKLRAYAASLRAVTTPSPSPLASATVQPTPTAAMAHREEPETLFSKRVDRSEVQSRSSRLQGIRTFLKEQNSQAQTSEGHKLLSDSITEIEALQKLLPIRIETPLELGVTPTPPVEANGPSPSVPEIPQPVHAENVANQLEEYRKEVREATLSWWDLDDSLDETAALATEEANKCRAATLSVRGIWLAAWGEIGMGFTAAVFLAFLILVLADFTQALLDTATNTGITASRAP